MLYRLRTTHLETDFVLLEVTVEMSTLLGIVSVLQWDAKDILVERQRENLVFSTRLTRSRGDRYELWILGVLWKLVVRAEMSWG